MFTLTKREIFQDLCKHRNQWGLFISCSAPEDEPEEMTQAAPYLIWPEHAQIIMDGEGFLFFESEKEMSHCYDMTVGDDGPTKLNPYNGRTRVYALTCNPKGIFCNENT